MVDTRQADPATNMQEVLDLLDRVQQARARSERLHQLAAALSEATTLDEVLTNVVWEITAAFAGAGTIVARITDDGEALELLRAVDLPEPLAEEWKRFPLAAPVPLAEVARTGEPIFLESRADWYARFPGLAAALEATGHHANAVLPLVSQARVTGALGLAFDHARAFDDDERALLVTIARLCAGAIERVFLLDLARNAQVEAAQAQRRADEARELAERANRAKSEFLAMMSHELRTPLNAIAGYAELLAIGARGPVTPEQRADLARIQRAQQHLLGLIDGILSHARLEARMVQYELEAVRVGDVIAHCEELVAPQAREKGQTLSLPDAGQEATVRADREKLQQIVLNLLSNAVKFTGRGGTIALACHASDAVVTIEVRDTGRGIAADQVERIFEPFVQIDRGVTGGGQGTGLGLAISRELARGMGGDLTAESVVGHGSTFRLTLPRG